MNDHVRQRCLVRTCKVTNKFRFWPQWIWILLLLAVVQRCAWTVHIVHQSSLNRTSRTVVALATVRLRSALWSSDARRLQGQPHPACSDCALLGAIGGGSGAEAFPCERPFYPGLKHVLLCLGKLRNKPPNAGYSTPGFCPPETPRPFHRRPAQGSATATIPVKSDLAERAQMNGAPYP